MSEKSSFELLSDTMCLFLHNRKSCSLFIFGCLVFHPVALCYVCGIHFRFGSGFRQRSYEKKNIHTIFKANWKIVLDNESHKNACEFKVRWHSDNVGRKKKELVISAMQIIYGLVPFSFSGTSVSAR